MMTRTLPPTLAVVRGDAHPRLPGAIAKIACAGWKRRGSGAAPERTPNMLLLLVDDNAVNRSLGLLMLERLGYQVDVVADGQEAIDAVVGKQYAAVLMDCEMPVVNGYAATAEIRRLLPNTPVPIIAMTANTAEIDRDRCLAAGMDDFLAKPVVMTELGEMLRRWVPAD
jgi:CheY-like chemotaxis protein